MSNDEKDLEKLDELSEAKQPTEEQGAGDASGTGHEARTDEAAAAIENIADRKQQINNITLEEVCAQLQKKCGDNALFVTRSYRREYDEHDQQFSEYIYIIIFSLSKYPKNSNHWILIRVPNKSEGKLLSIDWLDSNWAYIDKNREPENWEKPDWDRYLEDVIYPHWVNVYPFTKGTDAVCVEINVRNCLQQQHDDNRNCGRYALLHAICLSQNLDPAKLDSERGENYMFDFLEFSARKNFTTSSKSLYKTDDRDAAEMGEAKMKVHLPLVVCPGCGASIPKDIHYLNPYKKDTYICSKCSIRHLRQQLENLDVHKPQPDAGATSSTDTSSSTDTTAAAGQVGQGDSGMSCPYCHTPDSTDGNPPKYYGLNFKEIKSPENLCQGTSVECWEQKNILPSPPNTPETNLCHPSLPFVT